MGLEYYPLSDVLCHHVYNRGGCTFCGFKTSKKCVSKETKSVQEMIEHFEKFVEKNLDDIKKSGRLEIAPNGSWFTEVPKGLREHIYDFVEKNNIPIIKYQCRATLFSKEKARKEFKIMYQALHKEPEVIGRLTQKSLDDLIEGLDEINPKHIISLGLEVADDRDLITLNKGCSLSDYIHASDEVHKKNAGVCCNILLSPPDIEDPIYKAFKTAEFSVERLKTEELHIMPCVPMKDTLAHKKWVNGEWNPISATAASEIFRIIKGRYSHLNIRYVDLRVFNFHGRHGKHKRKPGKWSEEEKQEVRSEIREIARKVFKDL